MAHIAPNSNPPTPKHTHTSRDGIPGYPTLTHPLNRNSPPSSVLLLFYLRLLSLSRPPPSSLFLHHLLLILCLTSQLGSAAERSPGFSPLGQNGGGLSLIEGIGYCGLASMKVARIRIRWSVPTWSNTDNRRIPKAVSARATADMSAGEGLDEAAKDAADIAAFFKSGKSGGRKKRGRVCLWQSRSKSFTCVSLLVLEVIIYRCHKMPTRERCAAHRASEGLETKQFVVIYIIPLEHRPVILQRFMGTARISPSNFRNAH